MGKKKVLKQTGEELIKEAEKSESSAKKEPQVKVSSQKRISEGKIYISVSFNNIIMALADIRGNVLGWESSGHLGFKGSKKSTPYAASKVAEVIAQAVQKIGMEKVMVLVKGVGSGRESAVRSLATRGLNIVAIRDVTPIPHGGVRPPKPRRV